MFKHYRTSRTPRYVYLVIIFNGKYPIPNYVETTGSCQYLAAEEQAVVRDAVHTDSSANTDIYGAAKGHEVEENSAVAGVRTGPTAEQDKFSALVHRSAVCADHTDEGLVGAVRASAEWSISVQLKIRIVAKHAKAARAEQKVGRPAHRE